MQRAEFRRWLQAELEAAGLSDFRAESEWILDSLGLSRQALLLEPQAQISDVQCQQAEAILARRRCREPLQYILGLSWFYGLELSVNPSVLIPRPETEELVELALQNLPPGSRVADVGTGSGAIAIALAHQRPDLTVYATDISPESLLTAQANAARHHLKIVFLPGHVLEPLLAVPPLDLLISNPPYIPQANLAGLAPEVKNFEPHLALTPGTDPLYFYRLFASQAKRVLKPGGQFWAELEADLAQATAELFIGPVWQETRLLRDLAGKNRFIHSKLSKSAN